MKSAGKLRVGDYTCWFLADGELTYPGSVLLPAKAQLPEQIALPLTAVLVDTGTGWILIDPGVGSLGPDTGALPGSLAAAGISPADVGTVILSHGHPSHIGGLQQFLKAAVVMMRNEYEFWTASETQSKREAGELYGLGSLEPPIAACIRDSLTPAMDRLKLLDQPEEVEAGVLVLPAPGHTPGHAAVLITSERQQLLYVGDAVLHPTQFESPDWVSALDLSPDQAASTRKKLLDRAAGDRCLVAGFHLPGAVGAVQTRRGRFFWEPSTVARWRAETVAKG